MFKSPVLKTSALVVAWAVILAVASGYNRYIPVTSIHDDASMKAALDPMIRLYEDLDTVHELRLVQMPTPDGQSGLLTNGVISYRCNLLPVPGAGNLITVAYIEGCRFLCANIQYRRLDDPARTIRRCDFKVAVMRRTLRDDLCSLFSGCI